MAKRKTDLTKDFLINNCGVVEKDGELYRWSVRKKKLIPIKYYRTENKHKYAPSVFYENVLLNDNVNRKPVALTAQNFIYAWYKGTVPAGYNVDHINDNPLDNRPENLQLLTMEDNLKKKKVSRNQYSWMLTDEEILENRRIKSEQQAKERKEREKKLQAKKVKEAQIKALRIEWHDIVQKLAENDVERKKAWGYDLYKWRLLNEEKHKLLEKQREIKNSLKKIV